MLIKKPIGDVSVFLRYVSLLILLLCAAPQSVAKDSPREIRKEVAQLLSNGEFEEAFLVAKPALDHPYTYLNKKELERIVKLFTQTHSGSLKAVEDGLRGLIADLMTVEEVTANYNRVEQYWMHGLLTSEQKKSLHGYLASMVLALHEDGELRFSLIDDLRWMPEDGNPEVLASAFQRSLDQLMKSGVHVFQLDAVLDYVAGKGQESIEYEELGDRLPEIQVPDRYIEGIVGEMYPEYVLDTFGSWESVTEFDGLRGLMVEYSELKDPFTVNFRKTVVRIDHKEDRTIWCGQLNAKNSWGAYSGWARFVAIQRMDETSQAVVVERDGDATSGAYIDVACKWSQSSISRFGSTPGSHEATSDRFLTEVSGSVPTSNHRYSVEVDSDARWKTLPDWETPKCVESSGPITNGPAADLYDYKGAVDEGVVIAYAQSSGKIGGIYFRSGVACAKYARKYQELWLRDRNE